MQLPSIVMVSFYYRRHRALATSVVLCGSGVGKFVVPPLSRYLIDKYGWRGANCIMAGIILHGAVCGCVYRPVSCPAAAAAARSDSDGRPRPSRTSCVIMQKIVAEKRRRRLDSTGSLDGTLITSDGQLLRQNSPAADAVVSGLTSSGRSRTVSDPASADSTLRTFTIPDRQLTRQHSDEMSSGTVPSRLSTVRATTVSDPASADTPQRTVSLCADDGPSTANQCSSTTTPQTVSSDDSDSPATFSEPATIVADAEFVVEQSSTPSETSDTSTVVWLPERSAAATLNSGSCCLIEMTDLTQHRPPSLIHRPPSTIVRPHNVLGALSSRPDVFYTGSCLQVHLVRFC